MVVVPNVAIPSSRAVTLGALLGLQVVVPMVAHPVGYVDSDALGCDPFLIVSDRDVK